MKRRQGLPARIQTLHVPAPTGGLNTVSAGLSMPLSDCIQAFNLVGAETGLRTRLGYREHAVGLTGNVDGPGVRTVIPFTGSSINSSRLFVATAAGIFDVTAGNPDLKIAFPSTAALAGYGASVAFVTPGGRFLVYTDEQNGMYVYTESTLTWVRVTSGTGAQQVSGADPTRLCFVALFKSRLYFVEKDTSTAWYLPPAQVFGAATQFPLGQSFREGGSLVGMWNWTYDGGSGLDDSLVFISTGGDVVVYQGTDPSSASTFPQRGAWQMSRPPAGRRIASTYGGDLLLLSRRGLLAMSQLVLGKLAEAQYATAKIDNLINGIMAERAEEPFWGVVLQPEDNVLMVITPRANTALDLQLVQSLSGRGWFQYRDLPVLAGAVWLGRFYFGTLDGRVCAHTGYADNVSLATPTTFVPVDWGFLGAFNNYGAALNKTVAILRPLIVSDGTNPTYSIQARYDYDTTAILPTGLNLVGGASAWDNVKWNEFLWAGANAPLQLPSGALGMGASVAIAIRGQSLGRTGLVGVDVAYEQGGFL